MAEVAVDTHREQMIRLLEADRSYEFLTMALPYLDRCHTDHYVRLMAIREYLKLGLSGERVCWFKTIVLCPWSSHPFP